MSSPQITSVITTFNRCHFLPDAIDSILNQTFTNFELLILDNASSDKTHDVIARYKDPRIRYIRHDAMGISAQRNLAVRESRGEFIAFLDDDDVWLPKKLEYQYLKFTNAGSDCALVYGQYAFFDERGVYATFDSKMHGYILNALLEEKDGFCGSASNPMLRKVAIESVNGYPNDILSGEDYYLYLKLSRNWRAEKTEAVVVHIRQHQGPRLIGRLDARIDLEERILKEFGSEMSVNCRKRYLKKIGGKYIRFGELLKGQTILINALKSFPTDLEIWAQLGASFLGRRIYSNLHAFVLNRKKGLALQNRANQ